MGAGGAALATWKSSTRYGHLEQLNLLWVQQEDLASQLLRIRRAKELQALSDGSSTDSDQIVSNAASNADIDGSAVDPPDEIASSLHDERRFAAHTTSAENSGNAQESEGNARTIGALELANADAGCALNSEDAESNNPPSGRATNLQVPQKSAARTQPGNVKEDSDNFRLQKDLLQPEFQLPDEAHLSVTTHSASEHAASDASPGSIVSSTSAAVDTTTREAADDANDSALTLETAAGKRGNAEQLLTEWFAGVQLLNASNLIYVEGFSPPKASGNSVALLSRMLGVGVLQLEWDPELLANLGACITRTVSENAISNLAYIGFTLSVYSALSAVLWPVWMLQYAAQLDNTWMMARERAKKAGEALACALIRKATTVNYSVSLCGYSMGSRVILHCLEHLHNNRYSNIVLNVVLMGLPHQSDAELFSSCRSVVRHQFINVYSTEDWVLALMFRWMEWGFSVAGLAPVNVPGIKNFDASAIVNSHFDYRKKFNAVLHASGFMEQYVVY